MVISFMLSFGYGARCLLSVLCEIASGCRNEGIHEIELFCYNNNLYKYLINTQWRNITSEVNTADHNVNNIQDIQDP